MVYPKTDVLLTVDLFERLRAKSLYFFEIEPCYTYSTPGSTWLRGLKNTNVTLKFYKEAVNIYDTIKRYKRWVISVLGN